MGATHVLDPNVEGDKLIERVRAGLPFNSDDDDQPFALDIERALWSKYEKRPSWPPVYTRWRAP